MEKPKKTLSGVLLEAILLGIGAFILLWLT